MMPETSGRRRSILIGWELGAGRGHLARLVPIIRALREAGCDVVAAVRDVPAARDMFNSLHAIASAGHLEICQAPIFVHRSPAGPPVFSLPETMARIGFADPEKLGPVIRAWAAMIARINPDLIISDMAPSLVAAARGRIKTIAIGNGWAVPPAGQTLPPLPVSRHSCLLSGAAEQAISATFDRVIRPGPPANLASLLRGDDCVVCTPVVLDPYRAFRRDPVFWPPEIMLSTARDGGLQRKGIILYLPPNHPAIPAIDRALSLSSRHARGYFGGQHPRDSRAIEVSEKPLDFNELLSPSSILIHHGGTGVASYGLALQAPQIILPLDLEKLLAAHALAESGGAIVLRPDVQASKIADVFGQILDKVRPDGSRVLIKTDTADTIHYIKMKCDLVM